MEPAAEGNLLWKPVPQFPLRPSVDLSRAARGIGDWIARPALGLNGKFRLLFSLVENYTPVAQSAQVQVHPGGQSVKVCRLSRSSTTPFPRKSKRGAWTVGLNWFLNKNTKIVFNYERTHFTAIPGGRNRQTEKSFLERFQIAF